MDPKRPDQILGEWDSVARTARRPAAPIHRSAVRSGLASSGLNVIGALVVVVALAAAFVWLGGPGPNGSVGDVPGATGTAGPTPTEAPTPTVAATPTAQPTPSPTPNPASISCATDQLAARITLWEGAAGHRIAHVELTNAGSGACTIRAVSKPQLVDGNGSVLIDGVDPSASKLLVMAAGDVLTTLVQDANYCGPDPVAPVSVAFVLGGGGRIVATPVSPTDVTVPPCNGAAGSAGDIEMQPWAP